MTPSTKLELYTKLENSIREFIQNNDIATYDKEVTIVIQNVDKEQEEYMHAIFEECSMSYAFEPVDEPVFDAEDATMTCKIKFICEEYE